MTKLFVWKDMQSVRRYAPGKVIALAPSVEEARAFAIYLYEKEQRELYGEFVEQVTLDMFKREITNREPTVYTTLAALIEWGSE